MAEKPDWEEAYADTQREIREHLREERKRGGTRRVYVPGSRKVKAVANLTDQDIDTIALRDAERGAQRGINQWNAAERERRTRNGQAM